MFGHCDTHYYLDLVTHQPFELDQFYLRKWVDSREMYFEELFRHCAIYLVHPYFRTLIPIHFIQCVYDYFNWFWIYVGITYNGDNNKGEARWDGCANVDLYKFEGATNFGHYVESFNINTNHWVAQ